jgi:hypothetical protein
VNERGALVLVSTFAAAAVAAPLAWLFVELDSKPVETFDALRIQLRLVMPAMIAVAVSAWWHSRGPRVLDCPDGTLSARIAWWSFPAFGVLIVLQQCLGSAIFAERSEGFASHLMMSSMAIFLIIMLSSIVLFLPAFFAEYLVIRFVRSPRVRAALSGVDS